MKKLDLPLDRKFVGPAMIWKRIAAFTIDLVILNLFVLYPFRTLFERILPKSVSFSEAYKSMSSETDFGFLSIVTFTLFIIMFLYFFLQERNMSQTIGKKIMKIYIESYDKNLNTWKVVLRNIEFIPF